MDPKDVGGSEESTFIASNVCPWDDDDIPSTDKKKRHACSGKKSSKKSSLSTRTSIGDVWSVMVSGRFMEDDELSRSSSVSKQMKDRVICFKVLRAMQESFSKVVECCTYRLKNKNQRKNSKIASKLAKLVKKLQSQLNKTDFDKMDPISNLTFLREFCDVCDSIGIHEKVATWLVSHFTTKPASSSFRARLSPEKIYATGLHNERLSTYVKVFNYF